MSHGKSHTLSSDFSAADSIDAILSEFTARLQRGEAIQIDDFAAEHPEFARELKQLLPTARALAELSRPADHPAEPQFSTLGDFRLLREIGRGGMGVVYEAEQISLGRRIALKVLPFAGVLDPRQLQRFKNEARAAATLDHPHIVHVHAVGQDRGVHFYAMQLIEGQTLAELAELLQSESVAEQSGTHRDPQNGDVSKCRTTVQLKTLATSLAHKREYFRRIVGWGIEAAEALDFAHQMGIVHRDVKPSNLLINTEGRLWVTDFGLAMTRAETGITMTGDIIGTLRYMSPEQILGQRSIIDHRTDIYSLGITLFELLTLQPAYRASRRAQLMQQVLEEDPPQAALRRKSVPIELQLIVMKAIRKDVTGRYATAQELADDLQRYIHDQPIQAQRPFLRDRVIKWSRRYRTLVRSLIAAACITCCIALVALAFVSEARHQTDVERIARQAEARIVTALQQNLSNHQYVTRISLAERAIRYGKMTESLRFLEDSMPESRGFEWYYLRAQAGSTIGEIGRHRGTVYGMALSPNKHLLASYGQDGVRIWDARTHQQLRHLTEHLGDVNGSCFSPDENWFASTGDDGTARIRDAKTFQTIAVLEHAGPAGGGGFSPDGRLLMTGEQYLSGRHGDPIPENIARAWPPSRCTITADGLSIGENVIRVWNTAGWTQETVLRDHDARIQAGDANDDGTLIATGDADGVLQIRSMPDGFIKQTIQLASAGIRIPSVQAIDFAHNRPWIAVASFSEANVWNLNDGTLIARLSRDPTRLRTIAFSPDDLHLLIAGDRIAGNTGAIRIWKLTAAEEFEELGQQDVLEGTVSSVVFLSNDEVAVSGENGIVSRWRLPGSREYYQFQSTLKNTICRAAFSPNSRWLASTCSGNGLTIRSLENPDEIIVLDRQVASDTPVAFSADGRFLASIRDDTEITVWKTENWTLHSTFERAPDAITQLRFQRQNSSVLCALLANGQSQWWHFPGGSLLGDRHWDFRVATSNHTERYVIDNGRDGWQGKDLTEFLWKRTLPAAHVTQFSPDESVVGMGRTDGSIEILNFNTGLTISHCLGKTSFVEGLAFAPDNKTLASFCRAESQITLWHVQSGRELFKLNPGLKLIRSLEFSLDGHWLVAAGQNINDTGEVILMRGR